jgi:hypothetical protein
MVEPTDAGKTRIPTLQVKNPATKQVIREAVDNADKGRIFYETFFPPKNPVLTPPPSEYRYPTPQWTFKNIEDEQIHQAIKKMKPYKASKSGTVTNSTLIHTREILVPHLGPLFQATHTTILPSEMGTN